MKKIIKTYGELFDWTSPGDIVYLNNKKELHRIDGPAVERIDGAKLWYKNGKPHRLNGPAGKWASGRKEWYINGKYLYAG